MADNFGSTEARLARAMANTSQFSGATVLSATTIPAIAMPMHMGLDAVSCLVAGADGTPLAFAKTFRDGALDPFTFEGAAEAARRAGAIGIGPTLLGHDVAERVLFLTPAVPDWHMVLAREAQRKDTKAAIAAAKKLWHSQPLLGVDLSVFDLARIFTEKLKPHIEEGAADPLPFKGSIPFAAMCDWIEHIEVAFRAAGSDRVPIHGENTVSNILANERGEVLLVDFDRAVDADPLFDLGGLMHDLCREDRERMELVEMYAGRPDERILARMKLYSLVDDFVWGCWALLSELDGRRGGPEYYKYGNNRFVRLGFHLQIFDVPNLLLKI
ncbi:phosphotransferase family protein [Mesorhizobium sp. J428]|uniref:phosphotransferase family protein n=1 Tax=Mesorhizobium sp. J428 TaxID=2898440 RepID=UPI0021508BBB|nr:phosphotransferase [Mesorhizobium sp. J428]MCR5859401.1 phosphotransferase [Mesorhizobium sp. J428]